jgi:lysozyme
MMDPSNLALLISELRLDEGVRYVPYNDTEGIPTVGVGHNLQASPLPDVWSYPLTDDEVNQLLTNDLQNVFTALNNNLQWWTDLSDVRQRVLCNMCFQMGIGGLLGFRNTLKAVQSGNYGQAATGMLNSEWADQTPSRAQRLAAMMSTGISTYPGEQG